MQNQFYVYILKCNNDAYYVGHTDNIEHRLSEHHLGSISNCYTKSRRPLELMFLQIFATIDEAFHAERQIKGWSRAKKEALIEDNWEKIKKLNEIQKKVKSARRYPSTSSGRAQQVSRSFPMVLIQTYIVAKDQQEHYTFVFDQHTEQTEQILCFYLEAYAQLTVQLFITNNMRLKIECILRGQGAHARIHGAYMISDEHSIVIDTFQHHQAPHTSSNLIMKGALRDKSSVQYYGTIRVEKNAYKSYASQENKNILLSTHARAVSIPNLEVLTNDVKCFHASAVGRFDNEQLFYIASRGIGEKVAQHMLLQAFFADVFDDNEKLISHLAHFY